MNQQDERVMAALAHLSALLPMMGIIAAVVIWITQREKSRFVAFQSLQAVAYQVAYLLVMLLGMACYMASFFLTFAGGLAGTMNTDTAPLALGLFIVPFLVFFGMFAVMGIYVVYAIIAAVLVFQGKDFRYLLVGGLVERYMQQESVPQA